MVNTTEIRIWMVRRNNMSITELAARLGKSTATLARWLDRGDMPVTYAERIIEILKIPTPEAINIFFGLDVAGRATQEAKGEGEAHAQAIHSAPLLPHR